MLATNKDIPQLARNWYLEKAKTCFGGAKVEWSVELCALHLEEALGRNDMLVTVEKHNKVIIGACGSSLVRTIIPPHPLTVTEWMWWGSDRKATVRTWQECMTWGKAQGAQFARYTLNQAQANPKKWVEVSQWRSL